MARQELVNGESGLSFRSKSNDNFEELYGFSSSGLNYLGILSVPATGIPTWSTTKVRPDGTAYEAGDYYLIEEAGTYSGIYCEQWDALILNNDGSTWEAFSGNVKGPREVIQYSTDGTKIVSPPLETDPLTINTITHSFTKSYGTAPKCSVNLVGNGWWGLSITSISTISVVIRCSGLGDATSANFDYKILVF